MLRLFLAVTLLTSCSLGTKSSGGKHRYRYEADTEYTSADLKELASSVVMMESRDPRVGKLSHLFAKELPDLRRIGIIIFETEIQPTRSGLSGDDLIYLSEQGKQLVTEKFLRIWDEELSLVAPPELTYVNNQTVKAAKALHQYGSEVPDHINADRTKIDPDDIMWLPKGKKTPLLTVMNPRGMQDLSFMLVPASELMGGPKWSEHNKIFFNDICKELNLDAALVLMSEVSWSAARRDKFTNENVPEEMKLRIKATTLVPFGKYHERLKILKEGERPAINVAYRYHEGKISFPLSISLPEDQKNFSEIEKRVLDPMFKAYRDLSLMMIDQITQEIEKTH